MRLCGRTARRAVAVTVAGLAAVCLGGTTLAGPAAAEITVFDAYETLLAREHLPLVPTSFPAALQPIGRIEVFDEYASRGRYGEVFTRYGPPKPHAPFPSVAASLTISDYGPFPLAKEVRIARRHNRVSALPVRAGRGWLLRAKRGGGLGLLWAEHGSLYALTTATPKAIPLAALQATAGALDRLTGKVRGETPAETGYGAKNLGAQATAIVGERSALVATSWQPQCNEGPLGAPTPGGGKTILSVPLAGGALAFGPAPVTAEELIEGETAAWNLRLSGSLSAAGGQLTEQLIGTSNGEPCLFGPAAFALAPYTQ